MKNQLTKLQLFAFAALFIFASCSKNKGDSPTPETEKQLHDVSFRVKTFTQQIVPIASDAPLEGDDIDESIYKIQYLIYDDKGKNIANFVQLRTDEGFGSLSTKLPAGDFKIIAWATSGDVSDATTGNYDYLHANLSAYTNNDDGFLIMDSFFTTMDFSVSESSYVNDLKLERKTAKIELNLVGDLPENAAKIVLLYDSPVAFGPMSGIFVGLGEYRIQRTYEQLENYKTETGYSLTTFILPEFSESPYLLDLTITCQDEGGNMLYHEVIEGVEVLRNKTTLLTGSIVENEADNSEFKVSIDTEWDDLHEDISF